jgi:hypothetical protein
MAKRANANVTANRHTQRMIWGGILVRTMLSDFRAPRAEATSHNVRIGLDAHCIAIRLASGQRIRRPKAIL